MGKGTWGPLPSSQLACQIDLTWNVEVCSHLLEVSWRIKVGILEVGCVWFPGTQNELQERTVAAFFPFSFWRSGSFPPIKPPNFQVSPDLKQATSVDPARMQCLALAGPCSPQAWFSFPQPEASPGQRGLSPVSLTLKDELSCWGSVHQLQACAERLVGAEWGVHV